MSNKFEYPIERFLYNDQYTSNDLNVLELTSDSLKEEIVVVDEPIILNENN